MDQAVVEHNMPSNVSDPLFLCNEIMFHHVLYVSQTARLSTESR